jgi:alanyl-tRNA synthetase
MLGNWSFGDYFKRDALVWAWELLTTVYGLEPDKLWATVYQTDDESYDIWTKVIGLPADRVVRIGDNKGEPYASDNFWQMADTGPCGPSSEIFYDHGPSVWGGPPGSPEAEGDRYIEIWNNVFMQFDRQIDPQTGEAVFLPLPKPCVDTGMGLERLAAVLQHVHSNYEIDLFQRLIAAAARETHTADLSNDSLKVIADHIRACAFLVVDGVIPANEGRGYVLRRIVRRALRHGHKLGQSQPFFYKLVGDLATEMGAAYPELAADAERVAQVLRQEEERFAITLENGMKVLESALAALDPNAARVLDGETAFTLYDTYGFPVDLTADVVRERGLVVDMAGFDRAMGRQRRQAQAAGKFKALASLDYSGEKTRFVGYEVLSAPGRVVALYVGGLSVPQILEGEEGIVVLDTTPFYAESGGQVGDSGRLIGSLGSFAVVDTQKVQADVFGHQGKQVTGELRIGAVVEAEVDRARRARSMRNHSATHLMHKALREVLGKHVQQKGSLVDPEKTRFDFAHDAPMTSEEIRRVEELVNAEILENVATRAAVMSYDEAVSGGAVALFGEKYGDVVRVLDIGSSRELCGGTHVERTGDIGLFKVTSETGVASGIRRIEAVTGEGALALVQELDTHVRDAAAALKTAPDELASRIGQVLEHVKSLERELGRLQSRLAAAQGNELIERAVDVKGIKVLAATLEDADVKTLRETMDRLKEKLKTAAIVLGAVHDGKVSLIAGVTADSVGRIKAGDLVNFVAQQVGGKGGGKPDMAQAGGSEPGKLSAALASVTDWAEARL